MRLIIICISFLMMVTSAFAEIRVGALLAVTGPAGYLGLPEKQTLEMLVDEINKSGGIAGEKIKLIVYDTQGEESRAINYYKRLVTNDKVVVVLGPTRTGEAIALKAQSAKYKVPVIAMATSEQIVENAPFMFKTAQSDTIGAEKIFTYLKANNKTNIALLTEQSGYGSTGREAMMKIADKYGIKFIADEKFMDTDKDMTAQLSIIKGKKPDAIIVWGAGSAVAIVAKNAKQLGINGLIMSQGVASNKFIELAGESADGIILPAGRILVADQLKEDDRYKTIIAKYKKEFEAKYNAPVSAFGGHAYDSLYIFKNAYEKNKSTGAALAKDIETVKQFMGIAGEFNITPENRGGLDADSFIMITIKDGKFTPLE